MLTPLGRTLLQRWIYVLVKVGEEFVVPYTEARLQRVLADESYDADFAVLLPRCLEALAAPGWPAGSYYPGGWYRMLRGRGEDVARVAIAPEALAPFTMDEVLVDRQGRWFVGDKPVTGRILGYFLRNLHYDAELARYAIRQRVEQHEESRYLHHLSPPLRVRRVTVAGGRVSLWLNTGEREILRPETLRMDADEQLYCAVRGEGLPAWFEEPARWELLKDADERDGAWELRVGGQALPTALHAPWPYADHLPA